MIDRRGFLAGLAAAGMAAVTRFYPPVPSLPAVTAPTMTEVQARYEEALLRLKPVWDRLQYDLLVYGCSGYKITDDGEISVVDPSEVMSLREKQRMCLRVEGASTEVYGRSPVEDLLS